MQTKRMIVLALMTVMAGVLHFVEASLPLPLPIPGCKLGLANIISLYVLVRFGLKDALVVVVLRVLLGSLLSGTLLSSGFFMSFSGALVACLVMHITRRYLTVFSVVGVSVMGAVAHNISQLAVAALLIGSGAIWCYLPYLLLFAVFTGIFTGLTVRYLVEGLHKVGWEQEF